MQPCNYGIDHPGRLEWEQQRRTRDHDGACKVASGGVARSSSTDNIAREASVRARILCRLGNCSWQLTYQHTDDSTYGSRRRGSSECLARPCGIAVAANATLEPVQEICCSPLLLRHRRRSCFVDISHQVARVMRVRLCRPKRSEHAQQHISHRNRRHPARQAKHAAQNKARSTSLRIASTWHPLAAYCMQSPDGADALAPAVQLGSVAHQGDGGRATYTRPMAARRRPTPCRLAQAHAARWLLAQASADMAGPSCPPLRHGVGIPKTPRSVWRRRGAGKAHLADIAMHLPRNKAQGSH
ncbi:hypothetical protein PCL_12788 [Purpureocillium lilacinum]|uniref:Uncharacterized protein n=1 Tax=Purpureocillium lilacinum TaxID=33203 RepID=A0A2U3E7D7_PURLI|nr:hypothetical protein PCL_12788 [Purpureocillium lilacinum]